ncbi:adrenomedullin a [Ictalurus punctatus]|uniref:Pro-adrenomedullin n=1 Tax=Ictalurus punctatus TaxID=7998 RepID=A0A2D0RWF5_ICTPU|nr:adrenomedullin a [Ictalurus punctatus]XP_053491578.1 adrenomedullin a [Ictalurus furcatus]
MKLIVLSFFCCCLLLTVTPSVVDSAKLNLSQVLKRSIGLQRTKRDLSSLSALKEAEPGQFVRPDDVKDTLLPHSSTGIGVRTKRSKNSVNQSRRSGCSLGTCTVHDLAHRLHILNNKNKVSSAPADKISPLGYGRRRRAVPDRQMKLDMQGGHLKPVWRLHKLDALLRRT